jgi:cytoskeletal protein RodZ
VAIEEKGLSLNRDKNEHIHELELEIGKLISEGRISRGLSIEQMEGITKVSRSFIENIESGHFEALPGKVFGRGFIKSLSKALHLDTDSIMETYEKAWLNSPELIKEGRKSHAFSFFSKERAQKLVYVFPQNFFKIVSKKRRLSLYVTLPLVLLFVGLIVRPLWTSKYQEIVTEAPKQQAVVPQSENLNDKKPPSDPLISAMEKNASPSPLPLGTILPAEANSLSSKVPIENVVPVQGKSLMILTVKEEVKIKHRTLPEDYTTATFSPGVYKFSIEDRMDIVIFDASAVDINFNGKDLGVLGKKGEERKLVFSAKELSKTPEKKDASM